MTFSKNVLTSLQWQAVRATQAITIRAIENWAAALLALGPTLVLLMATRETVPLLTEPAQLLRVIVLVVILTYMKVTKDTHPDRMTQTRLSAPLIPVLSREELVGAISKVEATREEHTTNRDNAKATSFGIPTAFAV